MSHKLQTSNISQKAIRRMLVMLVEGAIGRIAMKQLCIRGIHLAMDILCKYLVDWIVFLECQK